MTTEGRRGGAGGGLERFVAAQDPVMAAVEAELAAGRKTTHWMWFVFPQIAGLGASAMSRRYAIRDRAEAQAYLAHPTLGPRLTRCVALTMATPDKTAFEILGAPDDRKFQSCLTLFAAIAPPAEAAPFQAALARFYGGRPDVETLRRL